MIYYLWFHRPYIRFFTKSAAYNTINEMKLFDD
jgi:hypothetical protein